MQHLARSATQDEVDMGRTRYGVPDAEDLQRFSSGVTSTLATAVARGGFEPRDGEAEQAKDQEEEPIFSVPPLRMKRAMDVTAAFLLLVVLAPFLGAIAVAIRLQGGPALYGHRRMGQGLREFHCLKFRTMRVDGDQVLADLLANDPEARREWRETRKLRNDPRVTWLGRLLRKSSIDELPQLVNVLRGEMSLVGPRPVVRDELDQHYGSAAAAYALVRPGITGLWQVSGRSDTTYNTRVALDTDYVRTVSLRRDLSILLRTLVVVARGRGAV